MIIQFTYILRKVGECFRYLYLADCPCNVFADFKYPSGSIFFKKEVNNRSTVHWGGFDMMDAEVYIAFCNVLLR